MNINQEILKQLIKNSYQNSLNYLENVLQDSLDEKKIEFLDSSFYDENDSFEFIGKLEQCLSLVNLSSSTADTNFPFFTKHAELSPCPVTFNPSTIVFNFSDL